MPTTTRGRGSTPGLPLYVQSATTDDPGFYRYPPLLAIAFRPLALLPFETAAVIWEAFLIVLFGATLVRLGLRNEWTWIVTGWLAAPIAWALAVGQAQVAVTFLLALGTPWGVALAGHLKILPVIVAIFWIGRRDWHAVGRFVAWLVGLSVLTFVLEPAGTIAFLGFSDLSQVGDVQNRSLYAISPWLWAASVVVLLALALRYATRPVAGWALAVSASVLVSPRLLLYQISTLQAGVRSPDDAVRAERLAQDAPALAGEHDDDDDRDAEPPAFVGEGPGQHRGDQGELAPDA